MADAADRPDPRSNHRTYEPADADQEAESTAQRRRRRATFLRELAEARELRARVQPHRVKVERARQAVRMRTFRY